jgi:type VI secretion system protein ImpJ
VRYRVRAEALPDLARGGFEVPVQFLVPNLRVFLSGEEENLEAHDSLRLFRVEATGELKRPFALCRTQSPPLLALQAFPPLEEEVRSIVAQIAAKLAVVASRTEVIAVGELPRMWMRYTLARMIPVLRQLLATGESRPFPLYSALAETAGALGAFRYKEAPELPAYEHADPYPCFRRLLDFIDAELEEAAPTFTELVLRYDPALKAYVSARDALDVRLVDPRNQFTLAIKAGMESQELVRWVAEKAKASSVRNIGKLVTLALPGLKLERLPGEPIRISGLPGAEFFKVEPYGDKWTHVREEYSFALSLGALTDADVRLYVVTPEA